MQQRKRTPVKQQSGNTGQTVTLQQKNHSPYIVGVTLFILGAAFALGIIILIGKPSHGSRDHIRKLVEVSASTRPSTVWQFLALSDAELEKVDIVELNLVVAKGIPGLENLNVAKYQNIVRNWTTQIEGNLPSSEKVFEKTPDEWGGDVRLFRLGQVAAFLNQGVGIKYIDEQKDVKEIRYSDPSDLFIHGLIDKKQGTCGNMPALHVAIGRQLGWPVSLASIRSHTVCRYDDGKVVYNIETTDTEHGNRFAMATDEQCIERFKLPKRAVDSGSDLKSMTARQMLGYFIALRARHFADTDRLDLADQDYALAHSLLPNHRQIYTSSILASLSKGSNLFEPNENGHPSTLVLNGRPLLADNDNRYLSANRSRNASSGLDQIDEIMRINAENRARIEQDRQRMFPNTQRFNSHTHLNPHFGQSFNPSNRGFVQPGNGFRQPNTHFNQHQQGFNPF